MRIPRWTRGRHRPTKTEPATYPVVETWETCRSWPNTERVTCPSAAVSTDLTEVPGIDTTHVTSYQWSAHFVLWFTEVLTVHSVPSIS